jgi:hypothetical protein
LAGSEVGFQIPGLGIFYPSNLTPDRETGIGTWSEADIIKAVRAGVRPDGRQLDTRNNRLIWPANRGFEALALF